MDANDFQKLEIRVRHLENWRDTTVALDEERRAQARAEFARVHARLDKLDTEMEKRFGRIDGHVSKLVWLVAGSIVTAFLAWVFNGGMSSGI
jgi:ABC-type Zn uptake system ZnuABC Zn-binding protein ZnuA